MLKKLPVNVFSAILALTAAVAFLFWLFDEDDAGERLQQASGDLQPEWYWQNARFWNFDTEGQLQQDATATDAKYFSEEDVIYLSDPRVATHSGDDSPWYTRAEFAQIRQNNDLIELLEDVELRKGDGEISIRSQRLLLTRSKNLVETELAVSLISPTSHTDAIGMRAWLKQQKVELLAKVKTIYEAD
jgi:lipopolysaccharide export system protein LptC